MILITKIKTTNYIKFRQNMQDTGKNYK